VAIIYIVISPCNRTEGNSKSTIFMGLHHKDFLQ
jgi:hypothetical protein